ncbi:phosphoglycerate mutase [Thermomonas sp.]|uniref:phosphoglycerate mutase n=1 Tax=Thermomonas sp. TaxID=1971895 RepID=UPI0024881B6F|nr:phosphoglycerate mutase [Thermomonas sp.]MDI1253349.1 phosphoglycerate mutase [Thermomonas sp.]
MTQLNLLLPAGARLAGITFPASLAKALGRADEVVGQPGEQAQLSRHFQLLPDRWPHAALTHVADAGLDDARSSAWLRADPAYIRPDINGARLLATGAALSMSVQDVEAFLPALRPLFGDAGFLLDAPHPTRWYLRLPRETQLPDFPAPDQALGEDVFDHMPDGPQARRWRTLLSETQVVLHNHPRNEERARAGLVPVNSLWFWGGGLLPDNATSDSMTVFSDDPVLHGLASVGTFKAMPIADFKSFESLANDALIDLRAVRDPKVLLEGWLQPAFVVATQGQVDFDLADGRMFQLQPSQRWRFWRKPRTALTA